MQIAGNKCKVCNLPIVLSIEGKGCPECQTALHCSCDSRDICAVCGGHLVRDEPAPFNQADDAILPPALRAGKNTAPALVLLLALTAGALMIFAFYGSPCGIGR